jgi:hypothetical protein
LFALTVFIFVLVTVFLTSLFKQVQWSSRIKNLIAVTLSVIGAGLTVIMAKGGVDNLLSADLLESIVLVYGGSQAVYNFILSGTAVENSLATIGSKKTEL